MRSSDEELMLRCKNGDVNAFELLVSRYQDAVMNFIYHTIGDYHRAEDLCQETFIKVFKNARGYRSKNRFKSWLFKIAANLCRNELRYRRRHPSDSLERIIESEGNADIFVDTSPMPDELFERKERAMLVKRAIQSLPENQRLAIVMREYESLRYDEIAYALGCSVGAVKSIIHRARQNLRKILVRYGLEEGYNARI
ncbi:sigma-70 family RNA polymerase sigma factor [Candidatus Poribacteria bacterium]|nr:sigma-70 family RNA polymerase sigma factor [Candidatus Poribacteria bacterium]